jgi:putative hydrolase of the HAD superfamily
MAGVTRPFDALTFDFWNTIMVAPRPVDVRGRRVDALVELLEDRDISLPAEHIDEALATSVRLFTQNWEANVQFTYIDAVALIVELLGIEPDDDLLVDIVDAFVREAVATEVSLAPNIKPMLESLLDLDVPVAIICDVGLAPSSVLRSHLMRHDVADLFDWFSFSDEVGVYKPHETIFHHALTGMGVEDPTRVAHIGDLRRTDVAGARAMGMVSVRYRGVNDDASPDRNTTSAEVPEPLEFTPDLPEADHVIDDHADLLATLGFEL